MKSQFDSTFGNVPVLFVHLKVNEMVELLALYFPFESLSCLSRVELFRIENRN